MPMKKKNQKFQIKIKMKNNHKMKKVNLIMKKNPQKIVKINLKLLKKIQMSE